MHPFSLKRTLLFYYSVNWCWQGVLVVADVVEPALNLDVEGAHADRVEEVRNDGLAEGVVLLPLDL